MLRLILPLLALAACSGEAVADYLVGMAVNSSSNMLLRPKGKSGTIAYLYARAGFTRGRSMLSYHVNGGMLEHYRGLQFQRHELEASYSFLSKERFAWNAVAEGAFSRYGSVTSLDGYRHFRLSSNVKSYLTDTLLFRWKGTVGRRIYSAYERESYLEASTIYRLDRFFASGTTLRGQVDAGVRKYDRQSSNPTTSLVGLTARIAQSVRPGWGVMLEGFARKIITSSAQDSSRVYNRVFLDDLYKYSSTGIVISDTHLIRRINSIRIMAMYTERRYRNSQTSYFSYLPHEGWNEHEAAVFVTLTYRPWFLPDRIHPVIEAFYTDVNATENKFSYDSTGVSLKIELH